MDGRCGLLTGDGAFRATRPLDEVLGLKSPAGREAFTAATKVADMPLAGSLPGVGGEVPLAADKLSAAVLEPVADSPLSQCIGDFSEVYTLLFIIELSVGAMFMLLVAQMLVVGNLTVMLR